MIYRKWDCLKHFIDIDDETAKSIVMARRGNLTTPFDSGIMYSIIDHAVAAGLAKRIVRKRGPKPQDTNGLLTGMRINKMITIDAKTIEIAKPLMDNNFSGYIERLIWEDSQYEHDIHP